MGIDQVPLFDAHIEIYTDDERIKIQYDTSVPFFISNFIYIGTRSSP